MELPGNNFIKKQRNAKIRRDKRKSSYSKTNAAGPEPAQNAASTPQPQKINNLQRNESSGKSIAAEETSEIAPEEVSEHPMVDHSNLKRETEEIKKLTKKFSKREVTSNWHRYATEENFQSADHLEEEAPADFADLLQVPVSRGGHLQLKEEQGWSSAIPRGHWALDLKQLSFSLACIPMHERLRLPLEKLSEEEIDRYVFLAEEAKRYYNGAVLKDDVSYREKPFNILDVERSTKTLLNMDQEMDTRLNQISANNINPLEKTSSNVSNEVKLNEIHDALFEHNEGFLKINERFDAHNKNNLSDLLLNETEKHNKSSVEATLQDKLQNNSLVINQQSSENNNPDRNDSNQITSQTLSNVKITESEKGNNFKTIEKSNTDPLNNYEIKEQRQRRTNIKKASFKEEIDSKEKDNGTEMKLEDKDDLDFLLTLKTPIYSKNKNESKPADLKDSSFLPGATVASSTTPTQSTDLDDWLDSVLED